MDGTGSGLCPLVGFHVSSVEPLSVAIIVLVSLYLPSIMKNYN